MPASGRSEAEAARSTREGRGDRSEAEGAARLGGCEVLCGAGWDSKGQPRGRRRRRKHRSE
ncbi:hypothetical protein DVK07_13355 [Halorubrum sp. Atlit-26R]|nr:hypothetical protein DVK07_13355 [Halorubrum sp. Atlit-26R]